uniref:NADH-ubiquinone oxidoreductase chain 6 n=1 Tax=Siphluriscus chinensis TaxID=981053 RepID=A0A067XFZ4_9INSE|nr:NADH dehydrogenase subunit 6 [Siphluriscus chinensis]UZN92483.1 NADH dehydrogenase subunit 6 [Siphluriscus sp. l JZ-2022]
MTELFLLLTMILSTILFTTMNHPLAMGIMLLMQTLLVCLTAGLTASSFWFSYILFLVFLGGMLVLFIYVTSLASNEMFSTPMKSTLSGFILMFIIFMISTLNDPVTWNSPHSNVNDPFQTPIIINSIMKIYNSSTSLITTLLVVYLLITLIAVVTITKINQGPLRPLN